MAEALDDAKARLRQEFLGRAGIHGLGVSRTEQAIRVYVSSEGGPDCAAALEELRLSAAPFPVIVVEEEPPRTL